MTHIKHWQDPVNAALGAALALSPWVVDFSANIVATTNAVVIGVALIAAAIGAMLVPQAWEEWTEALLGLWMILSPWLLGYSHHIGASLVGLLVGTAVIMLSLWTVATDKKFSLPRSMLP
jgi:SPW repeat